MFIFTYQVFRQAKRRDSKQLPIPQAILFEMQKGGGRGNGSHQKFPPFFRQWRNEVRLRIPRSRWKILIAAYKPIVFVTVTYREFPELV
ncbi:hypothetical protein CEXT_547221 [Caerostris extrusa]|uniref:Uncharacterized protein n=1 Tax=Caerostris extrusa TaxID=172846 RepID=A0AAV4VHY3_CAEEX|nr:hypothetical protein CEXT_547221 [Caerostris extrusa]